MADNELKFVVRGDATSARDALAQAKAASREFANEIKRLQADLKATDSQKLEFLSTGNRRAFLDAKREIQLLREEITSLSKNKLEVDDKVTSLKSLGNSSEIVFRQFTQLRIGLTQLARGDLGGIPNLIKSAQLAEDGIKLATIATYAFGAALAALPIVVVVGGIAGIVAAAEKMVEVAEKVGTTSKSEFEKLQRAARDAGAEITQLDRNLSQELKRAADGVGASFDGLFVELIRTAGPALIQLLKTVSQALNDLRPEAAGVGEAMADAFIAAAAGVKTFVLGLKTVEQIFRNPKELLFGFSVLTAGLIQNFLNEFDRLSKKAEEFKPRTATFEGKENNQAARDALQDLRERQKLSLEDLQRFREQVKREYDLRELDESIYTGVLVEVENERQQIIKDSLKKQEELASRKLKGNDLAKEIARITRERAKVEEEHDDNIEKINDESTKRLEQLGIQREQAILQRERAAASRQLEIIKDAEAQRIISHEEAEEQLAVVQQRGVDQRIALAEAEVVRAGQNVELRKIANEKLKALEIELAQTVEEAERRKRDARRRDIDDAINLGIAQREAEIKNERTDPLSARSLFGDEFAEELQRSGSQLRAFGALGVATFAQLSAQAGNFQTIAGGAVAKFGQGLGQVLQTMILTGKTGPAALKQLTKAVLAEVASQAAVKAIFELAEGFAALFVNPPKAAAHFTSAALYGAVAGVAGGIAASISTPSAGGGALGNSLSGTRQDDNTRSTEERIRYTERDGHGLSQANVIITLKHDTEQSLVNYEVNTKTSYDRGGLAKQVIDDRVSGTGFITG